ncbi:hypothetical protein KJZ63_00625 [Patescibacteria group bacterium]|nr:hypothetical protein [Patescibacteria group bacterium]
MNKNKLFIAILLSFAIFGFSFSGVAADTYGQENCTSTYGQAGCITSTEASKSAVYLADTALDTPSLIVAGGVMLSGIVALVLKKKIA